MAIRYDKKLNQEINKTIRNFNQKIARLEKTERDLILPSKITKKELKESVYNRQDLRRKLKELQRYSTRGIEETIETTGGVKISRYELGNIQREARRVKSSLTREINKLKSTSPKVLGKTQARTFAQMGDQYFLNLQARRKALEKGDIKTLTGEQLKQYKTLLAKTSRNKNYYNNIFKENYLQMLTDLGYYYIGNDKTNELKEKLLKLDSEKFLKLFREDKAIQSILYYYPTVVNKFDDNKGMYINPSDLQDDVEDLYNALIENIDEILKDYA